MSDAEQTDQDKKLTNSVVLEISRGDEARRIVGKYTGWAAGTGAIPLPLRDVAAVAAVQPKTVRELFKLYGAHFSESKAKSRQAANRPVSRCKGSWRTSSQP